MLPIESLLNYYPADISIKNACVVWGNISVDENSLLLTTLNHIYKIDIDTLDIQQLNTDFLTDKTQRYYLLDTIGCDKGYTIAYLDQQQQGVIIVDHNGQTVEELYEEYVFAHYDTNSSNNLNITYTTDCMNMFYADPDQTIIGIANDHRAYNIDGENYPPQLERFFDITGGKSN